MYWQGIVIGLVCFIIIGVFHPVIIKGEYYYGLSYGGYSIRLRTAVFGRFAFH